MVKKVFGVGLIGCLVATLAGAACSSTVETTVTDASVVDSAPSATTVVPEAAPPKPRPDAAPAGCYDEGEAISLAKDTKPPQPGANVCSPAQIDAFLKACLGTTSDATRCKAFTDAAENKACRACISGDATDRRMPVLLPANQAGTRVYANTGSCGYAVIGKPECAIPAASSLMCRASACDSCAANDTPAKTTCDAAARAGICKQYEESKACTDAATAGKAQIDAVCRGADFAGSFTKVATYLCGPPTGADGGADADDDGG